MEENNNENKMSELVKLMHKTEKAMEMTREKQDIIDNIKEELMEETRPMMVEQRKTEIEKKEQEKVEFDEMTKNALVRAKTEVLKLRKESEKEYQEKLLETLDKKRQIENKLKSMEQKGLPEEKLAMAQASAKKALTKVDEEMEEYQNKHFVKRAKLDEFESNITDYAIELGVEIEPLKDNVQETVQNEKSEEVIEPLKDSKQETVPNMETVNDLTIDTKTSGKTTGKVEVKGKLSKKEQIPNVVSVEVKDNKYVITYETKKDGSYFIDKKECKKLGIFKGLFEKAKLVVNRKDYGIDLTSAMRADINVIVNLNDKDKEKYLNYIAGQTAGCFDINYDNPKNRHAKALAKGKERLALKEAEALEKYGPKVNSDVDLRKNEQDKYELIFGEGFDQHDNPPEICDKATTEEVRKTVRETLYGNIEPEEK